MTIKKVLAQLESLGDEGRRKHNAKTGPDGIPGIPPENQFGLKTGDLRALAKKIKKNHDLALQLWNTVPPNVDAQMLAILIMDPKKLSTSEIDTMVRKARFAWSAEWLQSYIIKALPDADQEALREKWMKKTEKDAWAARAGWHLTASKINKGDNGLDVEALLDRLEQEMPQAAPETKWTMNSTLAALGINCAAHRQRALAIGEKIGLYRDWPMSKGCTIPYVPVWVEEMVKRKG
jgi:3-methyladenine DNA glycosylase AlkD